MAGADEEVGPVGARTTGAVGVVTRRIVGATGDGSPGARSSRPTVAAEIGEAVVRAMVSDIAASAPASPACPRGRGERGRSDVGVARRSAVPKRDGEAASCQGAGAAAGAEVEG